MQLFIKRIFDIISSGIVLILLTPVFIVLAIMIKIDSKGPIFFKQQRRTKNGRLFNMYKFRSMVVNAEKMGTGLFNYANDKRITRMGKFLRNSSLDELPQLVNIFLGDMSVVGPRPCVSYELGDFDTLNKTYKKRFEVKAGLTGLAQVKGRNDIRWNEKVIYDNEYVDLFNKYGFIIDLKIIFNTIFKVSKQESICENKLYENLDDELAAKMEEEEIIRLAHLPEEE